MPFEFTLAWNSSSQKDQQDEHSDNRNLGAFILINENTNNTIAAGTID